MVKTKATSGSREHSHYGVHFWKHLYSSERSGVGARPGAVCIANFTFIGGPAHGGAVHISGGMWLPHNTSLRAV